MRAAAAAAAAVGMRDTLLRDVALTWVTCADIELSLRAGQSLEAVSTLRASTDERRRRHHRAQTRTKRCHLNANALLLSTHTADTL